MRAITANDQHVVMSVGDPAEVSIGVCSPNAKLWVRRDPKWVPTVSKGPGRITYLLLTNLSEQPIILQDGPPLGFWMAVGMIPRSPGYVSVGSRRYKEWQTLAYEATVDRKAEVAEIPTGLVRIRRCLTLFAGAYRYRSRLTLSFLSAIEKVCGSTWTQRLPLNADRVV